MPAPVKPQSYKNHGHHPWLTYAASVCAAPALVYFAGAWLAGWHSLPLAGVLLSLAVICLISISRVYITSLQNRIIRLEMRVRLAELLPPEARTRIHALTTPQLVGLRFASDEELPGLVDRALGEQLSRDEIKRAIKTWVPDWERT